MQSSHDPELMRRITAWVEIDGREQNGSSSPVTCNGVQSVSPASITIGSNNPRIAPMILYGSQILYPAKDPSL
jgi:hypothetical protein